MKSKKGLNSTQLRIILVAITNIIIITIIAVASILVYKNMLNKEEDKCWTLLEDSADSIEREINIQIQSNINILKLVSGAMVTEGRVEYTEENYKAIISHLNNFKHMTIFERIDVLMENGSILLQTGELRTSTMNFEAIAKKGISTSGRRVDTDTGKEVIRCSVPVVKDGHTVAILLGVVVCEDLPEIFTSSMYSGNAYVCLIDRITGDFIMDSWHDSLQNFYEMPNRKMLPKYQNVNLYEEVAEGNTGVVAYESNVNGKDSYMYYRPIQNLDWQIIIVAQDDVVFESLETMESSLAFMFITIGALSTGYLIWCIFILVKAMKNENMLIKNSYIDSLTGVFNQNKFFVALEEFEKTSINGVGMVFLDLNGLKYTNDHLGHNVGDILLKDTANILTKNFGSNVYRIGGDEFVTISTNISEELINTIAENVKLDMTEKNIEISMGVTWRPNSKTIKTQLKEADDLMYIDKRNYHNKDI